jgi:alcohol dehydrogenase (NADP+)
VLIRSLHSSAIALSRVSKVTFKFQHVSRNMATHKLNTGAAIPAVGFGTWQDMNAQEKAVTEALKAGYKLIDTAPR